MKTGIELITKERTRQIQSEGWSADHDDSHTSQQLSKAAECYIMVAREEIKLPRAAKAIELGRIYAPDATRALWPWYDDWWKPSQDPIRNLVKAGALIAAEIDRLQRLKGDQ
jgi:hypothetical protein